MEKTILKLLNQNRLFLKKDVYEEIMHYYNHGEYEMALEGLMIEMVSSNISISDKEIVEFINLARYYKLDVESVFDGDLWNKFLNWVTKISTTGTEVGSDLYY